MCGIAGFSGRFDRRILSRMSELIAHRGPDDHGLFFQPEEGVGLAHRRLAIIDTSAAGHQPMWDATHRAAITFNGEIYNYRELKEQLQSEGSDFKTHTDTEVILNGYLRWGDTVLERLNGIFAFALWDSKRKCLLLARDALGVKPLYVARLADGLAFASEMKCLLSIPDLDTGINLESIYYHIAHLWSPSPQTLLKSVSKLEPGESIWVRHGAVQARRRFYHLPVAAERSLCHPERIASELRQRLSDAVRRQLIADVPVGAFLSGGLDSSAVVALARKHRRNSPMKCFTIAFEGDTPGTEGLTEDLPYARHVAAHLKQDLIEVRAGPQILDRLRKMIFHLDEPQADPACLNVLMISEAAREHGVKVLLSGAGGDDLLSGYRRHYALSLERFWSWWPRPGRALLSALARRLPTQWPPLRRTRRAFEHSAEDHDTRLAGYFMWLDRPWLSRILPWKDKVIPTGQLSPALQAALSTLPPRAADLDRMLYLETRYFLADHNLAYTDKMSMAAGIEVRVPFLDTDLVQYAASIPNSLKLRGATGKWILRQSMRGTLPRRVINRPKTGFALPLRHWLRGPLRSLTTDLLSSRSLEHRGLFSPSGVAALVEHHKAGRIDAAYPIFALLCIELWFRTFLDQRHSLFAPTD